MKFSVHPVSIRHKVLCIKNPGTRLTNSEDPMHLDLRLPINIKKQNKWVRETFDLTSPFVQNPQGETGAFFSDAIFDENIGTEVFLIVRDDACHRE